jgi:hypothetical protein
MSFKIKIGEGVTSTDVDGQTVLFSTKSGRFFGLNATAKEILWKLQSTDFESLAKEMAVQYKVTEVSVAQDLSELVEGLMRAKLIVKSPLTNSR